MPAQKCGIGDFYQWIVDLKVEDTPYASLPEIREQARIGQSREGAAVPVGTAE